MCACLCVYTGIVRSELICGYICQRSAYFKLIPSTHAIRIPFEDSEPTGLQAVNRTTLSVLALPTIQVAPTADAMRALFSFVRLPPSCSFQLPVPEESCACVEPVESGGRHLWWLYQACTPARFKKRPVFTEIIARLQHVIVMRFAMFARRTQICPSVASTQ